MGKLFDKVDLQMKCVEILFLLEYWDAFVSKYANSSCGFVDAVLWPRK